MLPEGSLRLCRFNMLYWELSLPQAFLTLRVLCPGVQGQGEEKGATLSLLAFHPYSSAVRLNQSLAYCQSETHTAGLVDKSLLNAVHAVKYLMKLFGGYAKSLVGYTDQEVFTLSSG